MSLSRFSLKRVLLFFTLSLGVFLFSVAFSGKVLAAHCDDVAPGVPCEDHPCNPEADPDCDVDDDPCLPGQACDPCNPGDPLCDPDDEPCNPADPGCVEPPCLPGQVCDEPCDPADPLCDPDDEPCNPADPGCVLEPPCNPGDPECEVPCNPGDPLCDPDCPLGGCPPPPPPPPPPPLTGGGGCAFPNCPGDVPPCNPLLEDCGGGDDCLPGMVCDEPCDPLEENCNVECPPGSPNCDDRQEPCDPLTEDCDNGGGGDPCDPVAEDCDNDGGGGDPCDPMAEDCDTDNDGGGDDPNVELSSDSDCPDYSYVDCGLMDKATDEYNAAVASWLRCEDIAHGYADKLVAKPEDVPFDNPDGQYFNYYQEDSTVYAHFVKMLMRSAKLGVTAQKAHVLGSNVENYFNDLLEEGIVSEDDRKKLYGFITVEDANAMTNTVYGATVDFSPSNSEGFLGRQRAANVLFDLFSGK